VDVAFLCCRFLLGSRSPHDCIPPGTTYEPARSASAKLEVNANVHCDIGS
jgi:hypothetical protein